MSGARHRIGWDGKKILTYEKVDYCKFHIARRLLTEQCLQIPVKATDNADCTALNEELLIINHCWVGCTVLLSKLNKLFNNTFEIQPWLKLCNNNKFLYYLFHTFFSYSSIFFNFRSGFKEFSHILGIQKNFFFCRIVQNMWLKYLL